MLEVRGLAVRLEPEHFQAQVFTLFLSAPAGEGAEDVCRWREHGVPRDGEENSGYQAWLIRSCLPLSYRSQ